MSLTVKHPFTSAIADDPTAASAGQVLPSHWNTNHTVTGSVDATQMPALTGDVTTVAGAVATTLATVNSNTGNFGSSSAIPVITVNGKGLITAVSTASPTASIAPLVIDSANVVSQRNTTNAQTQKVYQTDDGAGNASWVEVSFSGGVASIASKKSGTGTEPNLTLDVAPSGFSGVFKVRTGFDALVVDSANAIFGVNVVSNILRANSRIILGTQIFTPTTGSTVTPSATGCMVILNPAGTLATLTVTLPTGIEPNAVFNVRSSKAITALTVNAAGGATVSAAPTVLAAGQEFSAVYDIASTTWFCAT